MADTTTTANGATALNQDTELIERARSIQPLLGENASWGDEHGELAPPVVDALHEGRFFYMWVPQSMGGYELSPTKSLQVISELAYGDASTAWVLMAAGLAVGTGAAYLGDAAVEELFSGERSPVIAGQGTRPGKAVAEDGGYSLSGSWQFASGIKHAGWIHTAAIVEGSDPPDYRIFVLPVEQGNLIDNWDVMGLRGTGSIDYTIDGVHVDDAWCHPAVIFESPRGGGLYQLGIIGFAMICHAGWALGVGRRMLDEFLSMMHKKAGRAGQAMASDALQQDYARAEAKYLSAKALIFETWNGIEASMERGEPVSTRQQTMMRLALYNMTWSVHEVCMFVYTRGGTTALRAGTIQRYFRDMHAGTQHVTSAPPILQAAGRELAGLAPNHQWIFLELVDTPA
jgi:alkylation response protein AidB-like acyl-CoA dehydrogenase